MTSVHKYSFYSILCYQYSYPLKSLYTPLQLDSPCSLLVGHKTSTAFSATLSLQNLDVAFSGFFCYKYILISLSTTGAVLLIVVPVCAGFAC